MGLCSLAQISLQISAANSPRDATPIAKAISSDCLHRAVAGLEAQLERGLKRALPFSRSYARAWRQKLFHSASQRCLPCMKIDTFSLLAKVVIRFGCTLNHFLLQELLP